MDLNSIRNKHIDELISKMPEIKQVQKDNLLTLFKLPLKKMSANGTEALELEM